MYIFLLLEAYNNLLYYQVFIWTASDDRKQESQEKHIKQKLTIFSEKPRQVSVFEAIWKFFFYNSLLLHMNNPEIQKPLWLNYLWKMMSCPSCVDQ